MPFEIMCTDCGCEYSVEEDEVILCPDCGCTESFQIRTYDPVKDSIWDD